MTINDLHTICKIVVAITRRWVKLWMEREIIMNMKINSPAKLKVFAKSPAFVALVEAALVAQAKSEVITEHVRKYIQPVFERFTFTVAQEWTRSGAGEVITDPKNLYLCGDDALCAKFYAECDIEHRKHGFNLPDGHCPALAAQYELVKAEQALLKFGGEAFGAPFEESHTDNRAKALKLLLGLGVQSNNINTARLVAKAKVAELPAAAA